MMRAVISPYQDVRILVVHGLTERNDFRSELAQQRHALSDNQIMKFGAASGLKLIGTDLD